jgi:hypothetical protein
MNSKIISTNQKAQEAIEAVSYLFAVAAEKNNPFTVTLTEYFEHYKIGLLQLNEEEVYGYFSILEDAEVIIRDSNLPFGIFRIDYTSLVNLIILSFEESTKPRFLVLCGWENVVRQDSIPESVKEFLIAYQTLNVDDYFFTRFNSIGEVSKDHYSAVSKN